MKPFLSVFICFLLSSTVFTQDQTFSSSIKTIQLYRAGDQTSFPIIALGSSDALELHFDDLDNHVKYYYYTFELRNADWSPSILHPFEYIQGFQNARITTYRNSSLSTTQYIHYQATLPNRNCYPNRSGNYILKVFLDNDTSKLVFTKRMVIVDMKASLAAQIRQPYRSTLFNKAQRLTIGLQTDNRIQILSPSDLKVTILQNNNWQTSVTIDRPTIYRGNYYEYSDESQTTFPALKEFRWLDLRSLRLKSDRMLDINNKGDTTKIMVKPDRERASQIYVYYRDLNGNYTIETLESINPFWQGDYAFVHFSYIPPDNKALEGRDLYMFGEVTNYASDTSGKMNFNKESGVYEKTMFLKQGYYSYLYATKPTDGKGGLDFSQTEGNYFNTENNYIVLVYYRPFGERSDQVIAYTTVNSFTGR